MIDRAPARVRQAIGRLRRSRLASNSSVYLGGTLLNRLFPFFLTPLYTRTMTPHEFGIWGFCMTVLNALLIVGDLGIGSATTRLYWDHAGSDGIGRFLTVGFLTRIGVAFGVSLGLAWPLMAAWQWLGAGMVPTWPFVPLLLGCSAVQAIVAFNLEIARSTHNPILFSKIQIGQTILQSAVGAALVLMGSGAVGPIIGYLAGAVITAIIGATAFVRRYGTLTGLDWSISRASLRYGIASIPISASTWLRRMADRIMVGRAISMSNLAIYQVAASGLAPLTILMGSINSAYLPYYYEQRKRGDAVLPRLVAMDSLITAGLAAISLATIAVVPELIYILAPPSYAPAAGLASWFVLIAFFGGLTLQFTKELQYLKRPELAGAITMIPSLCGVAANLVVIPRLGAMGATMVGTVVSIVIFVSSILMTQRIERTGHKLVRLGAACAVVTAFAVLFAQERFVPFALLSLALRLGVALLGLAAVLAILDVQGAWRRVTGAVTGGA
ncbi:lipopolysaccharide biosynthesis protein [Sphingomonas prati]|uniref:O-antigen/teichoic acid export membrane protein n=1 Tax=Sphingomonas prati TaxID=1843237 RepID=A0A7W9BSA0_9SPHN|nr:oligosaccharide flippase family protein [Sphingomonas prati]MBB5729223.1 O-antigen/teichoic acid export membrane protein [Sphingomonas prati]GGE84161.1 polysaccharide biosynthesis protein [Sphingomonas prati]